MWLKKNAHCTSYEDLYWMWLCLTKSFFELNLGHLKMCVVYNFQLWLPCSVTKLCENNCFFLDGLNFGVWKGVVVGFFLYLKCHIFVCFVATFLKKCVFNKVKLWLTLLLSFVLKTDFNSERRGTTAVIPRYSTSLPPPHSGVEA